MLRILSPFILLLLSHSLTAQSLTQTVRGRVTDIQSEIPLPGATIVIKNSNPVIGTISDPNGNFILKNVPIGRTDFEISFVGYEPRECSNILILSGKETILEIKLQESVTAMEEVRVVASTQNREQPLNSMAEVSARQFTVEETRRYAGSFFDPARMASSFAGVSSLDGESNEIIVRGNSPRGILWRMEGIEVPNPNHFRDGEGASGGGVAMITSDVMANSDFYTGAFPAEYGNALSGVLDINLRKGNPGKREYSLQAGVLGMQASFEGPFKKGGQSSYLLNYRHAVFTMLEKVGITVGDNDIQPAFDDLAFNLNFVSRKAGNLSIFGLGGKSSAGDVGIEDSSAWTSWNDKYSEKEFHRTVITGLKYFYPFQNQKTYLRTVLLFSDEYNSVKADTLGLSYRHGTVKKEVFEYPTFRASSLINHKWNAQNTVRAGAIFSLLNFSMLSEGMNWEQDRYENWVNNEGQSYSFQAYTQWQHRFSQQLDMNAGAHYFYFGLNRYSSFEPRFSMKWNFKPGQSLSYGFGMHSKMEALSVYFTGIASADSTPNYTNKKLGLTRAFHQVLGYDILLRNDLRLKLEAYYQYLFDVPQPVDRASKESGVNFLNGLVLE